MADLLNIFNVHPKGVARGLNVDVRTKGRAEFSGCGDLSN